MERYLDIDPWKVVETGFHPERQRSSESIFSIGNGRFGQRANHEEHYSGDHHRGSYVGGVYYPDKTKVGWWKNGYPEYFAKVLNAPDWTSIRCSVNGVELDLHVQAPRNFRRELDMEIGLLSRTFEVDIAGAVLRIKAQRFCSMSDVETAYIRYAVDVLAGEGEIRFTSLLDGDVYNEDTNWDEAFWEHLDIGGDDQSGHVLVRTRKTEFHVGHAFRTSAVHDGTPIQGQGEEGDLRHAVHFDSAFVPGSAFIVDKHIGLVRDFDHEPSQLLAVAQQKAAEAEALGWNAARQDHAMAWSRIWEDADITIEGDAAAQQAIRFNIFHLNQTYTGDDPRLNVGPKGFTGEKYGGASYWDTEAYCLPFFLGTHPEAVARQLLVYRRQHLDRAIENAGKLGFTDGAALYPMVTMNGEECHNEWEITFEEIHRNGAMVYAIHNYIRYTGDQAYLAQGGWEVILGVARFWAQRVNWSEAKQAWVILGVTGPNEYENNVNNNWYTNRLAAWCLRQAVSALEWMRQEAPEALATQSALWNFDGSEVDHWQDVADRMYYPLLEGTRVFLQQDGFMDKEQSMADDLPDSERPINQHWSWDRILRSVYIKQADTLQGLYFFEDEFDEETHRENFEFYEPRTVHESSLSPCVHVVLAAKLGMEDKAVEMYLRTARLDLDDYNREAYQGLHITSMAGTWMSVIEGFGGFRVVDGVPHFNAMLPGVWQGYSFRLRFRGRSLQVQVKPQGTSVALRSGDPLEIMVDGQQQVISC